jgi:hypothetical protein
MVVAIGKPSNCNKSSDNCDNLQAVIGLIQNVAYVGALDNMLQIQSQQLSEI